jgi:Uma2 family endonuclease
MVLKKRTDMISAMDAQDVGCPDLAFEVDSTEWILQSTDQLVKADIELYY